MNDYLVMKLQGPMQAWGAHTYEDYRPSNSFPTRSAIIGLIGACMGIDRADQNNQQALSASVIVAVRQDDTSQQKNAYAMTRLSDFHTVEKARKTDGKENKNPVVTRREYLCDVSFTVALCPTDEATGFSLKQIEECINKPVFTPFLGRRSCPLTRPLFETCVQASSFAEVFSQVEPNSGVFYSDIDEGADGELRLRDIALNQNRQFGTRSVFIHSGSAYVS